VNAAYNLAVMYMNGEGVAMDQYKAEEWFTFAAARGHKKGDGAARKIQRYNLCFVALMAALTMIVGTLVTWGAVNFFGGIYDAHQAKKRNPVGVPRDAGMIGGSWPNTAPGMYSSSSIDDDLSVAFSGSPL
jgi:hypothetical protein